MGRLPAARDPGRRPRLAAARRRGATRFDRYLGIDYSGARTPTASLPGLRVYEAGPSHAPREVPPPAGPKRHWTRRGVAEWLAAELARPARAIVGIDHAFSFPLAYFGRHGLAHDWDFFLDDFQRHWPTDGDAVAVEFVRDGRVGAGAARSGSARWRRVAERRSGGAKSVFHFDVPGSVAKSTHAGLPWLRWLRRGLGDRIHVWPFDGFEIAAKRSVVAEVYPSLWSRDFPREDRTPDQHDAWTIATWLRAADSDRTLRAHLEPPLGETERAVAAIEGWILGVGAPPR